MILVIDNFDSFTWNLVDYIQQQGEEVELVRNDVRPEYYQNRKYKGILLSPGPGTPESAGYLMEAIRRNYKTSSILGVCLGHQAIGQFFGASIEKAPTPTHGKISSILCDNAHPLFKKIPNSFNVVRYHSLVLNNLPDTLITIATTQNLIMGISHISLPIYGIQFHPEAFLTEFGQEIIKNWLQTCKITG